MKPQLSVIIPAYNVSSYLRACVESVLHQHWAEGQVEIIIIDDGSTDATPVIADTLAKEDKCVRVVHQSNQGVSCARNKGLSLAQGSYVMFVDADDSINEGVLVPLLGLAIGQGLDVLCFQYAVVTSEGKKSVTACQGERMKIMTGEEFMAQQRFIKCFCWRYLIERRLLETPEPLSFVPRLRYEDVEWLPRMVVRAKRMMVVDTEVYQYYQRANSFTHSYSQEAIAGLLASHQEVVKRFQQQRLEHPYPWYDKLIWGMCESALTLMGRNRYADRSSEMMFWKETLRSLKDEKIVFTGIERLKQVVIGLSPSLYCWLRQIV